MHADFLIVLNFFDKILWLGGSLTKIAFSDQVTNIGEMWHLVLFNPAHKN